MRNNKEIIIDSKEFEKAQRDPRVKRFLKESDAYLNQLDLENRNL